MPVRQNRRDFLKTSTATAASAFWFGLPRTLGEEVKKSPNERLVLGAIGTGDRWGSIMHSKDRPNGVGGAAMNIGDYVAVCDVDAGRKDRAKVLTGGKADTYSNYREVLDRKEIDAVTIITPDHWHTKIAIEALKAGKDIYCEKPLTLTIEEGRQICKVVKETGRVFQVGTQQRTEFRSDFLKAVAIAHSGRLGDIKKVTCAIGSAPADGGFPAVKVPEGLDWNMWLGQAPLVDYRERRCHYEFRWWCEYSGGKMTDWGAHHVDIAQWAIGMDHSGPKTVEPVAVVHPIELEKGWPTKGDGYNVATTFKVKCVFPNGVEMWIRDEANELGFDNGILIEGTKGKILVNRGKLVGGPVEELEKNPLPEDVLKKLLKGKEPGDHMRNFAECIRDRGLPASDVFTHHRAMTTCHLANIAIRLGKTITWDAEAEQIVWDEEARAWETREQRKGFEIV